VFVCMCVINCFLLFLDPCSLFLSPGFFGTHFAIHTLEKTPHKKRVEGIQENKAKRGGYRKQEGKTHTTPHMCTKEKE
jgi:hypothetical protein